MTRGRSSRILAHYFFATYVLILLLCLPYLRRAWLPDFGSDVYALALDLTQTALYLMPALLLTRLAHGVLVRRCPADDSSAGPHLAVCAIAVVLTTFTAVAISADCRIFEIFGFHLNGFVLNLVTTPGGVDSMGLGAAGVASFVRVVAGLAAIDLALMWGAQRIARPEGRPAGVLRRRLYCWGVAALAVVALGERATYAIGESQSRGSILAQANAFPFYFPITARNLLLDIGLGGERDDDALEIDPGTSRLRYPLAPLRIEPPAHPPNVVWLVGESLRWDTLDPEIMPATSDLARNAWRFSRHYSGGNGTRMGMFSMFYGLHGPYWFEFLAERRSPVLMDVLQQQGYQLGLFTSARFSYPEFDRTIFANVPSQDLHDSADNYEATDWERGWRNDRARVSDLLAFLEARDRTRPFFAFMFFESTHYRYYFPDESVVRTPYARDLDLDDLASEENAELSHARYVNAAHHLDSQIARILDALRQEGRLRRHDRPDHRRPRRGVLREGSQGTQLRVPRGADPRAAGALDPGRRRPHRRASDQPRGHRADSSAAARGEEPDCGLRARPGSAGRRVARVHRRRGLVPHRALVAAVQADPAALGRRAAADEHAHRARRRAARRSGRGLPGRAAGPAPRPRRAAALPRPGSRIITTSLLILWRSRASKPAMPDPGQAPLATRAPLRFPAHARAASSRRRAGRWPSAGPESLTVSAVAHAAGINRTTAYQHFRTRDELVRAVTEELIAEVAAYLEGQRPIVEHIDCVAGYFLEHPELARLAIYWLLSDSPIPRAGMEVFHQETRRLVEGGGARNDADPEMLGHLMMGVAVLWPLHARIEFEDADARRAATARLARELKRVLLYGLLRPEEWPSLVARSRARARARRAPHPEEPVTAIRSIPSAMRTATIRTRPTRSCGVTVR